MREINDRFLSSQYSKVLSECFNGVFGFECDDGWMKVIDGTLCFIRRYAELNKSRVKVVCVKEKFGSLMIHFDEGDDCIALAVGISELVSGCVCEVCGDAGGGRVIQGSQMTVCRACAADRRVSEGNIDINYVRGYGECYAETLEVILSLFGSDAMRWVQAPAIVFAGMKPYELMATLEGCREVIQVLRKIEYGVFI